MIRFRILSSENGERQLLIVYLTFVAFSSAALPIGQLHLKFDWVGAVFVVGAATVVWALKDGRVNRTALLYVATFSCWLVINILVAALSGDAAVNMSGFTSYFLQFVLVFLTFLAISSFELNTDSARRVIDYWIKIACAASLLAIVQVITDDIIVDKFLFIPYYDNQDISRKVVSGVLAPTAWFSEASWFSSFLVVPFMFALFEVTGDSKLPVRRSFYSLATILIGAGLFLAFSLTAIMSIFVGTVAIFLFSNRSRVAISLIAVLGILAVYAWSDAERVVLQLSRFTELFMNVIDFAPGSQLYGTATSFYVRSVGFHEGLSAFFDNPFFGLGVGQGGRLYHSGFITLLAEQGLLGIILYFFPLIWMIRKLSRIRKHGEPLAAHLATAFLIILAADYANGLITFHSFNLNRWLLISIIVAWVLTTERRQGHYRPVPNREPENPCPVPVHSSLQDSLR